MSRGATGRPLLVPVLALLRQPGTRRPVRLAAVLGELRVGEAWLPADAVVTVDLVAEATGGEAITVTGEVRSPYRAECRRCLEELDGEVVSEVREIFERHPAEGETYPLEGEVIDLGPLVRETVLLGLPLAPLCREDCPGPAPARFPAGPAPQDEAEEATRRPSGDRSGDGDGDEPETDPRWAALRQLHLGE
jgi:uncharacterized protein